MQLFQGLLSPSKTLSLGSLSILVIVSILISPDPAYGGPLTKKQLMQVRKLLEDSIVAQYPSDDADQYSDLLTQTTFDKKNLTYYHAGNKDLPVFLSLGQGNVGKKVHILLRGEDYLNPRDRSNFVVLLQQSSGSYSVHMAHVLNIQNIPTSRVIWNDCRVEQQTKLQLLLELLGNYEVAVRSNRSQRPSCQWLGYTLLCDGSSRVPPMRERAPREPLDKEDAAPVRAIMNSEEEAAAAAAAGPEKTKRNIGRGIDEREEDDVATPNQLNSYSANKQSAGQTGDGVDDEAEEIVFNKSSVQEEPKKAPASEPTQPEQPAPIPAPSPKQEESTDSSSSKKKHKRRHKSKHRKE